MLSVVVCDTSALWQNEWNYDSLGFHGEVLSDLTFPDGNIQRDLSSMGAKLGWADFTRRYNSETIREERALVIPY